MHIVQQIGNLLLGSVPTMLIFIVLVVAYQFLVQGPLTATLRERRARTEGAVEEAHKAIAQAEARAAEYAETLRLARAEVFKIREARVKQWTAERDAALDAAREAAGQKLQQAKTCLLYTSQNSQRASPAAMGSTARTTWQARSAARA